LSNIAFRLYRFREYKIVLVQLFYIPFCIVIIARGFYFEFLVLKLMLFALPLLRNIFINYICWWGKPELQVDLETVLLSPLFNFFLIMCAVHGRLKCILWYLPNVPPNHGMLQRCRPRGWNDVDVSNIDFDDSATISTAASSSVSDTFQIKNGVKVPGQSPAEPKSMSKAETLLLNRHDTYELFERDGSSSIVMFHREGSMSTVQSPLYVFPKSIESPM
jgi:hypothetical protein